jgi:hypothetical protein
LKREIKATKGSVIFLFGLTITKGPVGMPMANAYGKITGFVKEPNFLEGFLNLIAFVDLSQYFNF